MNENTSDATMKTDRFFVQDGVTKINEREKKLESKGANLMVTVKRRAQEQAEDWNKTTAEW